LDSARFPQALERWSQKHALAMSCALAATLLLDRPRLLGSVALPSFGLLLVRSRTEWTPDGRFGAANWVTSLRLLLEASMLMGLAAAASWLPATFVLLILALDGLDGWLARRFGTSSAFGAHFDMEVDAFLVLATSVLLWRSGKCGAWILTAGVLRYAYVSCCALWPPRGGTMPRQLLGRSAFALVVVGHALGFALPRPWGPLSAGLGTAAVTLSFARSFFYGYRARPRSMAES